MYHDEFQVSRDEFDRFVRPVSGDANILAGVGDGFNTPITICNMTQTQVHLNWSYSRPARGDVDPLFRSTRLSEDETGQLPQALLDDLALYQLADPWARYINPKTVQQHSVFHWISRCISITVEDV